MIDMSNKSKKTQDRIDAVQADIKHYLQSINRLKASSKYHKEINHAPHAPRIIKYSCIPRSEKLLQWTLQNITTQMKFLEIELETLINYGK
ncbi:MAG: hypothetical protein K0S27_1701 [Gammaproteobacteria bacterium]|jgi:hypothetical protein|nr:hypothetical protein [Gammaproteobacteria bacterium]